MTLNLYLDDCMNSRRLAELLQQAGHQVVRPTDVGQGGRADHVHFQYAVDNGLTVLTKNPADFEALHNSGQLHFGILAVYQDNDQSRDMKYPEIVKAIANLCQAAQSGGGHIHCKFHSLNDWR